MAYVKPKQSQSSIFIPFRFFFFTLGHFILMYILLKWTFPWCFSFEWLKIHFSKLNETNWIANEMMYVCLYVWMDRCFSCYLRFFIPVLALILNKLAIQNIFWCVCIILENVLMLLNTDVNYAVWHFEHGSIAT